MYLKTTTIITYLRYFGKFAFIGKYFDSIQANVMLVTPSAF